jgi:hypothetical protein
VGHGEARLTRPPPLSTRSTAPVDVDFTTSYTRGAHVGAIGKETSKIADHRLQPIDLLTKYRKALDGRSIVRS